MEPTPERTTALLGPIPRTDTDETGRPRIKGQIRITG